MQRALTHLVEHGLVHGQEAGRRAVLYTLNRDHLAYPAVEILARLRSDLLSRARESIAHWEISPVHASVFGSASRGDGDTQSDIDVFLVRPRQLDEDDTGWRAQVDELIASIARWTGNPVSVSEVSEEQIARLKQERPEVVAELARDSTVLAGRPARDLLRP